MHAMHAMHAQMHAPMYTYRHAQSHACLHAWSHARSHARSHDHRYGHQSARAYAHVRAHGHICASQCNTQVAKELKNTTRKDSTGEESSGVESKAHVRTRPEVEDLKPVFLASQVAAPVCMICDNTKLALPIERTKEFFPWISYCKGCSENGLGAVLAQRVLNKSDAVVAKASSTCMCMC